MMSDILDRYKNAMNRARGAQQAAIGQAQFDKLGISEDEIQEILQRFMQQFQTGQAQTINRLEENAARGGVSPQALAAQVRGAGVQGNLGAAQGAASLEQLLRGGNRDLQKFLLQFNQNQANVDRAFDAQQGNMFTNVLSGLLQNIGFNGAGLLGNLFGGSRKPGTRIL